MLPEHLSSALFRETRGQGFFRVLSGQNAVFYIDVLDSLERAAADRPEGMAREDAIALITETLEIHPDFEFDEETGSQPSEPRDKARLLLNYLVKTNWLDEPPRRDWRRAIHFDAHGVMLIQALRKIAWPDAAVFTDKLIAACSMLFDETAISEKPWQTVETCISNVRDGLSELQAMQKSIQLYTRKQLHEETLKGNLAMVFDDYSEQLANACYTELVRARLPLRLPEAVMRVNNRLMAHPQTYAEMQAEVLRRNPEFTHDMASAQVGQTLDELIALIERVLPMADEIDRRAADFVRRSLARFRYLQDITGERRTEIKSFFEKVNTANTGKKISQIDNDLPPLRLPSVKVPAGMDSLYTPPTRRKVTEQDAFEDSAEDSDRQDALDVMGAALRDSLSVHRANLFVKSLPGKKGEILRSSDIALAPESGLTDLISLILHSESKGANYRLEIDRISDEETIPEKDIIKDDKNSTRDYSVEKFTLIKK